MKEEILFKGKSRKLVTVVQTLFILLFVAIMAITVAVIIDNQNYCSHRHAFYCANDESENVLFTEQDYNSKKSEYSSVHDYMQGEYQKHKNSSEIAITCECDFFVMGDLEKLSEEYLESDLELFTPIWAIAIVALVAFLFLIKLAKQKYFVEAERIYGKKGYKKFDISFKEILEMKKYDKKVMIKTEKAEVELSLSENYDEICGLIEPFVPVQDNATAGTSVVDDIKLF